MHNKLLLRQISKHYKKEHIPQEFYPLLQVISESYDHYEKDRKMLERSIEITSAELTALNDKLRQESEATRQAAYDALRESLQILHDSGEELPSVTSPDVTLQQIVNVLKEEIQKRKQAERSHEREQVHLQASQRIAHVGSWEMDFSSDNIMNNKVHWSEELSHILGYDHSKIEMTAKVLFARVHPHDKDLLIAALNRAIETHTVYELEHNVILPGKRVKPVYGRAEIIYSDKTGKPLKVIGTIQDISERKKARQKLEKAHTELKTLFDNMQEVFYSVDMEKYKLLQISKSCEAVYGRTVKEFVQNPNLWLDVVLEEDKHIIFANSEAMHAGQSFSQEYRIRHKDGSIRWMESRLTPSLNKEGKLIRLDGTTVDITKRKEAELGLKDSENRFRYLIDNCADAILIRNEDKEIVYCSDSVYSVIGYKPEEIIGKKSLNDIHPEDLDIVLKHWDIVLESPGIPTTIVYRRIRKDGQCIWCEGTSTNMLHQPEVRGIVVNFRDVTEQKEAELALKNSESKFRYLISQSADAIIIVNEQSETIYASDSLLRVTGYTADEIMGKNTIDSVHPDDLTKIKEHGEILQKNPGVPVSMSYRRRNKKGNYIWCDATAINLLDRPEVNGILINFRDVTEQKEAEFALKDSEYKFRSLIEYSADAVMVLNKKGETVYASDSLCRIMGYEAEEVLGIPSSEFIYPEDVPIIEGNLRHVLKAPGKPSTITYRRVKKDGTIIWCEGTANNLLHQPAVRGIVVNFRDVTDRKNIEIALRNSEYKYRSLFENSADAVIVIDEHWKITYASESLYNILGYTPAELLGIIPDRFIHPDDLPVVHSQRKVSFASPGKAIPITNPSAHRRIKKDGTAIWSEGTITNLLDEPAIKGLVINFRDITDRKASEDALRQSNEELKKSNTELDRFVYSVSHDLRAPLTSMLGIISIAKDETGDENMLSYMSMLQESITKLDGFIHDILNYSRNARIDIKRQQIDFKTLLNDVTDNLRFMNPEVPVEIRMQIDETAPYYSDKGRISVILNNLISNAIRYYNTEAEKPFVDITIKPSGGNILLTVKDNGIGINEDKQDRIFEMFYRVSQRSTGSGLGLYIVKETVEKLNGDIKLVSEPLKGSCFSILIPNL